MNNLSLDELDVLTKDLIKKLDSIMYIVGQEIRFSDVNKEIYLESVSPDLNKIIKKCMEWDHYCGENGLYFLPSEP